VCTFLLSTSGATTRSLAKLVGKTLNVELTTTSSLARTTWSLMKQMTQTSAKTSAAEVLIAVDSIMILLQRNVITRSKQTVVRKIVEGTHVGRKDLRHY